MPLPEVLALIAVLTIEATWLLASLAASQRLGSAGPLWLCWPARFWDAIYGRPAMHRPRADYAKIARLERELGISD
ncbi:hypothetical protein [Streptomyces sp. NPDC007100]|uniref:hypothetical protein n=1 Tax=Streptomyces sp. NPDC007100 TaxID=3155602 RepID=UPI003400AB99